MVKIVVTRYKGDDSSCQIENDEAGKRVTYTFELEDWQAIRMWKGKDRYTLNLKDMKFRNFGKK